jgi:hypothetical protein
MSNERICSFERISLSSLIIACKYISNFTLYIYCKKSSLDILKSHIFRLIKEELEDGDEGNQSAQYANYDVVLILKLTKMS